MSNYATVLSKYFETKPLYLDGGTCQKPNIRKLVELPCQQTKAKLWNEVTQTLCNLDFIQAKAAARMIYELLDDFITILSVIPDNSEQNSKLEERKKKISKYIKDLLLFSKKEILTLETLHSIKPLTDKQIDARLLWLLNHYGRIETLQSFFRFASQETLILHSHARYIKNLAAQQAWNNYRNGPIGDAVNKVPSTILNDLFLKTNSTRPYWNPLPTILRTLSGHNERINTVSIIPDGRLAITASSDGKCILWDLRNGRQLKSLIGHTKSVTTVAITPDGSYAVSGSIDNKCIIWELTTGKPIRELIGHNSEVLTVAITPDGKRVLSGSSDKTCILWDSISGKQLIKLSGHSKEVTAICLSPDSRYALSGGWDKSCILWDLRNGNKLKILNENIDSVQGLSMTHDAKIVCIGTYGKFVIWEPGKDTVTEFKHGDYGLINGVKLTSDGNYALSSYDKVLILWDVMTRKPVKVFKGHNAEIASIDLTPDGKFAISASEDNLVIIWDVEEGHTVKTFKGHNGEVKAISISSLGEYAVSVSPYKLENSILWNMKTFDIAKSISHKHLKLYVGVYWLKDDKIILFVFSNFLELWDIKNEKLLKTKHILGYVISSAISDDKKILYTFHKGRDIIIWDIKSLTQIKGFKGYTDDISSVLLINKGGNCLSAANNNSCKLWDLENGVVLTKYKNIRAYNGIMTIMQDGFHLLTAMEESSLAIWNLETDKLQKILIGHQDVITAITVTADRGKAITVSKDCSCIIWDLENRKNIARYFGNTPLNCLAVYGSNLLVGTTTGEVLFLKVPEYETHIKTQTSKREIWESILEFLKS